jgi:hypothetical protein
VRRAPNRHRACKPPGADVIARISGFPRNLRTYPSRPRAFKSTGCLSAIRRAKSGSRRGCEERTGRSRLQWTAAQDGPRTGRRQSPAEMRGNRSTEGEPGYHQLLHARPARGVLAFFLRQVHLLVVGSPSQVERTSRAVDALLARNDRAAQSRHEGGDAVDLVPISAAPLRRLDVAVAVGINAAI